MIIRSVKLKLTSKQKTTLEEWLWHLTGVWNWAIRKIENDANDRVYYSEHVFQNLLANHSEKLGIPSHTLQGMLGQAYEAWQRCFDKLARKPRMKGARNHLSSIPFPDPFNAPKDNRILIPYLGKTRFHKQSIPDARIKRGRIVKRASGWYLCLWFDHTPTFPVNVTDKSVGIDPGFSTLLTLSDGNRVDNPKELQEGALRLAQAQRAKDKPLAARLQERQLNRRRDRNHKISRRLVEDYAMICYSKDNFSGMAKRFGKSISQAALGELIGMLDYKCRTGGRTLIPVKSQFTTMTCSNCGARNGPTGLAGLAVRHWECACGAQHDRDINAACNILNAGLGRSLKGTSDGPNWQQSVIDKRAIA